VRVPQRALVAVLVLAALGLALASCTPDKQTAADLIHPEPVGLRADAPSYARHGPFWVGYQQKSLGEGDRALAVQLWYPARNPNAADEDITYAFSLQPILTSFPDWPSELVTVVDGRALSDAKPDASAAPYPLVVFSHGFGLNPVWYNTLLEHYASHGFVVLAPQHTDPDWAEAWQASIDRPQEILRALDYAEQLTASGGDLAGLIDMERVAVVGHSFGGYTALAMGGARFDLETFELHAAELIDDPSAWIQMPFVGKGAEMAARAGLDSIPDGLWPTFGDPRVDAIVPISSDAFLFDERGLAAIGIPVMAVGGTADTGAPYAWGTLPAYEHASSASKSLVGFVGAEHMVVATPCENMAWIEDTPLHAMFCGDPAWEKERALDLVHHLSTAFLLDVLTDDSKARAALLLHAVAFDGIEYETTLK